MNIIEALQKEHYQLRITCGDRWLHADGKGGWIVYEQLPYKTLIETKHESAAVEMLLNEQNELK
ncbi:MAG: hypothetical protein GY804_11565 [Alphaproteobacteria bacterium]|nr:hypothetical protein [Alphaproteobacteria bacterium]